MTKNRAAKAAARAVAESGGISYVEAQRRLRDAEARGERPPMAAFYTPHGAHWMTRSQLLFTGTIHEVLNVVNLGNKLLRDASPRGLVSDRGEIDTIRLDRWLEHLALPAELTSSAEWMALIEPRDGHAPGLEEEGTRLHDAVEAVYGRYLGGERTDTDWSAAVEEQAATLPAWRRREFRQLTTPLHAPRDSAVSDGAAVSAAVARVIRADAESAD